MMAIVLTVSSACGVSTEEGFTTVMAGCGGAGPREPTRAEALASIDDLGVDDPRIVAEIDADGATAWFWLAGGQEGWVLLEDGGQTDGFASTDPGHIRLPAAATVEWVGAGTCSVEGEPVDDPGWLIGRVSDDRIVELAVTWIGPRGAVGEEPRRLASIGYFLTPVSPPVADAERFRAQFLDRDGGIVATVEGPPFVPNR